MVVFIDSTCVSHKHLDWDLNMIEHPINNADITSYSIDECREILKISKNEIEYLWKMKHENIITMLGIYYEGNAENMLPMLVMESIQYNLCQYMENSTLCEWNNLFGILEGASSGLIYLHEEKNISHNNISERTILLTKHLVVKLSSFEYAKPITSNCYGTSDKNIFDRSVCDTFADVRAFGEVMYCVTSCKHLDASLSEQFIVPLHSFANKCENTCKESHPSSLEILDAIKMYR